MPKKSQPGFRNLKVPSNYFRKSNLRLVDFCFAIWQNREERSETAMENHFAENLPILRRRAGYTQETLAEALGISRQSVGKWEKGQTMPEANTLLTLAGLLGCSLDTLVRAELSEEGAIVPVLPEEEPAVPEPEPMEGDMAIFEAYDTCMNRVAALIGLGVGAIQVSVGNMMFLLALGLSGGASAGIMLLGISVAIFLIVAGGLTDEAFKREYPHVPDLYTQRQRVDFRKVFNLGCAGSVGVILVDVAVFVFLGAILSGHERMTMVLLGIFLTVMGLAVGLLVFLGCLSQKYEVGKRNEKQTREGQAKG